MGPFSGSSAPVKGSWPPVTRGPGAPLTPQGLSLTYGPRALQLPRGRPTPAFTFPGPVWFLWTLIWASSSLWVERRHWGLGRLCSCPGFEASTFQSKNWTRNPGVWSCPAPQGSEMGLLPSTCRGSTPLTLGVAALLESLIKRSFCPLRAFQT